MLKLTTQANSKVSRPGGTNLRTSDSVPNFALARNVVSEGFLANLKYFLTERKRRIRGDAGGSSILAEHFRASFADNLKECFRPASKLTGNTVSSLRGVASPGIKIESEPLYRSVFINIRDAIVPPKLPPLELTSKPVEVPEIWSKHRRLSGANVVSVMLHVSLAVLVLMFGFHQVTNFDPAKAKPVTVLIAPPAPGTPPPSALVATPTVTHRMAYTKRKSFFVQGKLTSPVAIPKLVSAKRSADELSAPDLSLGGIPGGGPAGILGGVLSGESGGIPGGVPGGTSGAPPPPGATTPRPGLVRVGGNVRRPKAIYTPAPEFPALAQHAKITGVVTLEAVVDEQGNVVKVWAIKGNALLINAALKAVAQWKFEPTYLDGLPVSVEMEVDVSFHFVH
jgi:periplasmic protein TonB